MQIALKELKVLGTFSRTEIFSRCSRSLYVATGITASIFQWGKQFRWRCSSVEFSLGKFLLSVTSAGFKSAAVYTFAVRLGTGGGQTNSAVQKKIYAIHEMICQNEHASLAEEMQQKLAYWSASKEIDNKLCVFYEI